MRKFLAGLAAGALVVCAGYALAAVDREPWPAGSKVVGSVCFEHATASGWAPAQLRLPNGALPVKQTAILGPAYFPMDAGQLRLRACP